MLVKIPNYKEIEIKNLVLDFNGTLATSGRVNESTKTLLQNISEKIDIYVVTADTFGTVKNELADVNVKYQIITKDNGTNDKQDFIINLGSQNTVAIGNGQNDKLMLKRAIISICIVGNEGCFIETLLASDIVINSIDNALNLLIDENKLIATLRK